MRRSRRGNTALAAFLGIGLALACAAGDTGAAASSPPAKRPATKPAAPPHAATSQPARPTRPPIELAREARSLEEFGVYSQATDVLLQLRRVVPADADLELELALDQARSGRYDSAAVRLKSPLLSAALVDSASAARRHRYLFGREELWLNGRFDGWHWYVARARAEVAAAQGRWPDAYEAAQLCVRARPLSGKEWLILALAAGRSGHPEETRAAVRRALELDPMLPEAHYLHGLQEWSAGRRNAAQAAFRAAVELDSSYRAPALALVRSKLPGTPPDTLPARLLNGIRETDLLTSSTRPKPEEFIQKDTPAEAIRQVEVVVPDSLKGTFKEARLSVGILIDERGRVVLNDLSWFDPKLLPEPLVGLTLGRLPEWRFKPATRLGAPQRVWSLVLLIVSPS